MSRIARIVVPGLPHHVTQRGNHRAAIFFEDGDYALYRDLLAHEARRAGVAVWAWCLMPNHVHLILVPGNEAGLAQALGRTHRRYAGFVNARARRTGHLFQERFASAAMDEAHLLACLAYVSLNPVRARLVDRAEDWPWSSVRAHLGLGDDGLTDAAPALDRVPRFRDLLDGPADPPHFACLRQAEVIGRPLGDRDFVLALEGKLGRKLLPEKRGPKPKNFAANGAAAKR
ncbi:MAG: transposase [Aestuariivirga sp.]